MSLVLTPESRRAWVRPSLDWIGAGSGRQWRTRPAHRPWRCCVPVDRKKARVTRVSSGEGFGRDRVGPRRRSFASGERRNPVPICTEDAPEKKSGSGTAGIGDAASAMTGTRTASTTAGKGRTGRPGFGPLLRVEGAAVPAGLHALGDNGIGARTFSVSCFGDSRTMSRTSSIPAAFIRSTMGDG